MFITPAAPVSEAVAEDQTVWPPRTAVIWPRSVSVMQRAAQTCPQFHQCVRSSQQQKKASQLVAAAHPLVNALPDVHGDEDSLACMT